MTTARGPILGLGEILWDLLPDGPRLGGAPFNFAFHCHRLGWPGYMVSRIGQDERGEAILAQLRAYGLSEAYLQRDAEHPTGTVSVCLDAAGQPTYNIHENVAWDFLHFEEPLRELLPRATAICFGTLAQRHPVSRATIRECVKAATSARIVFDVNMRQHYWDREGIEASLRLSHWVKLNADEVRVLDGLLGLNAPDEVDAVAKLRERYDLELVCLTRGADGCLVQTGTETIEEPGIPVTVVDTVGAGDAFTAALVVGVLEGRPLPEAVRRANRLASRVAASRGGTPLLDPE